MPELKATLERLHAEGTNCNLSFQITARQGTSDDGLNELKIAVNPATASKLAFTLIG